MSKVKFSGPAIQCGKKAHMITGYHTTTRLNGSSCMYTVPPNMLVTDLRDKKKDSIQKCKSEREKNKKKLAIK